MADDTPFFQYLLATGLAAVLLLLTSVLLFLISVIYIFTGSTALIYLVVAAYAACAGYIVARLLTVYGSQILVVGGVLGSISLGIVAAVKQFVADALDFVGQPSAPAGSSINGGGASFSLGFDPVIGSTTFFLITLFLFNAPILYAYYYRQEKQPVILALYLIPVIIYYLLPTVLRTLIQI